MYGGKFSYIEAPIHQGQKHIGVADGPAFLKKQLARQGFYFQSLLLNADQSSQVVNLNPYKELSFLVENELRAGNLVFTAGGDHSLSLGSVQGALRFNPDLKVLWVDAHGDINTRKSSPTGSLHGMPLAFLSGADILNQPLWFKNFLRPENLIYFGVRDLDKAESHYLSEKGITCFTTKHIKSLGLSRTIELICREFSGSQVLVSVDADAFDPEIAPSTGVPVPAGLRFNEVEALIRAVTSVSNVISFEYVELNPHLAQNNTDSIRTAQLGIDLFKIVLEQYNYKAGGAYGGNDRQCYTEKPDLLYPNF